MGCSNSSTELVETPKKKIRNFEKFYKEYITYKEFIIEEDNEKSLIAKTSKFKLNNLALECQNNYKNQEEIISNNYSNIEYWTDNIFVPEIEVLFGKSDFEYKERIDRSKLTVLRLEEIFGFENYTIFPEEFKISDNFNQCSKSNVYYYSIFKTLFSNSLIFQNFKSFEVKKNGQYSVTIKIDGEWNNVYIDDNFICDKYSKKPYFLTSDGNSSKKYNVFMMLLEKAWAKVNDGYLKIQNYNLVNKELKKSYDEVFDILSSFADFPINYVYHSESKNLSISIWNKLNELMNDKNKLILLSKADDSNPIISKFKISKFSLYIIDSIKEILIDNNLCKMIILKSYYKDSFKDTITIEKEENDDHMDNLIYNKDKDIIDHHENYYTLTIALEDYINYFDSTYILELRNCLYKTVIKCNHQDEPHPLIFKFLIEKSTFIHINSIKPSWRFNKDISMDLEMQLNLILCKNFKNESMYITSTHHHKKNPYISEILDPGEYFIHVHALYLVRSDNITKIIPFLIEFYSDNFTLTKYTFDKNFNLARACLSGLLIDKYEDKIKKDIENNCISIINTNDFNNLDYDETKIDNISSISGFCSYGLIVIQNFYKDEIIFTIKDNCVNFILLFPSWKELDSNKNVIKLKRKEIFIIIGIKKNYDKNSLLLIKPEIVKDYYSINTSEFIDYCNCDISFINKKGKLSKCTLNRYFDFVDEYDIDLILKFKEKELKRIFYFNLFKSEYEIINEYKEFYEENIEKMQSKNNEINMINDDIDNQDVLIDENENIKFDLDDNSWIFGETNYLKEEIEEESSQKQEEFNTYKKHKKMTLLKKIFHGYCFIKIEKITIVGIFKKNVPQNVCLIIFPSKTKLIINFEDGYPNGVGFQIENSGGKGYFLKYEYGDFIEYIE